MALQPSPDDQNDNVDIVKELPAAPTPSLISLNCSDGFLWCRPFEVRRMQPVAPNRSEGESCICVNR